jgi:hypothetical protein
MTFVCTASPPYQFDTLRSGNRFSVDFRVGYDDADDINYLALIGLGGAEDGMEYFFCLMKVEGDGEKETRINESANLPAGCTRQHRSEILAVILAATDHLLRDISPHVVYRAIAENLPVKALAKHNAVSQVFMSCGYRLAKEISNGQYRIMCMER